MTPTIVDLQGKEIKADEFKEAPVREDGTQEMLRILRDTKTGGIIFEPQVKEIAKMHAMEEFLAQISRDVTHQSIIQTAVRVVMTNLAKEAAAYQQTAEVKQALDLMNQGKRPS